MNLVDLFSFGAINYNQVSHSNCNHELIVVTEVKYFCFKLLADLNSVIVVDLVLETNV